MESAGISLSAPNVPNTDIGAPPSHSELQALMAHARRERSLALAALFGRAFRGMARLTERLRPDLFRHKASHSPV